MPFTGLLRYEASLELKGSSEKHKGHILNPNKFITIKFIAKYQFLSILIESPFNFMTESLSITVL